MGWSATSKACDTEDKLTRACIAQGGNQNSYKYKGQDYFWEHGREQADGAITGSVWRMLPDGLARRVGSFRIDPDGTLVRGPFGLNELLQSLEPKPPKPQRRSRNPAGIPRWSPYYPKR
jgi:hypothetical protein